MHMQYLIMVQELEPVSLFQNFDLGKASTYEKWHLAIRSDTSYRNQCIQESWPIFTFSQYGPRQSLDQ